MLGELRCPEYTINKISYKRDFFCVQIRIKEGLRVTEIVGMLAGILTTCAFFPQVLKTIKTRSTDDLSWTWLVMMIGGVFFWLVYGIYMNSISLIISNAITFVSVGALFGVKYTNYCKTKQHL